MGRAERQKGGCGEREVVDLLKERGYDSRRAPYSGALYWKGDVLGLPGYCLEVKRQERLQIPQWLRQAKEQAEKSEPGTKPLLVFRRSREEWHACLPFSDLLDLMEAARVGQTA